MNKTSLQAVGNHRVPARGNSSPSGGQIDAAFVISALKRWTLVALPFALLFAAGGGAAIYFLYEPEYQATNYLRVELTRPYIAFRPDDTNDKALKGEVEILRNPAVIGPLHKELMEDPEFIKLPEFRDQPDVVAEIRNRLSVRMTEGSELMSVSFKSSDPQWAAKIVNLAVTQYLGIREEFRKDSTQKLIEKLEEEKTRREQAVQDQADHVRQLTLGLVERDPFVQYGSQHPVNHPLSDLQSRVTGSSYSQRVLQKEIELKEEKLRIDPPVTTEAEIKLRLFQEPGIIRKQQEIWDTEEEYEQYRLNVSFGPRHPKVRQLKTMIDAKKDTLEKLLAEQRPKIKEELEANLMAQKEAELQSLRSQLESLKIGEQFLQEQLEQQAASKQDSSEDLFDLETERKALGNMEQTLDQISTRILALRTEQSAPARISEFREAVPPATPVEEMPYKKIALVGLVGFCIPFGLALLWEIKVRRFSHSNQIAQNFESPLVAEVANLPRRAFSGRRISSRMKRELRVYEESVDSLRTNLMLVLRERQLRVIAVTSSVSGEGKTSLASHLAMSIAKATGKPILLVDGDMRAPDVHHLFDLDSQPGLAEVLAGKSELQEAVVESGVENLWVLPAGLLAADPAYLLSNGSASRFFQQVRKQYEYVILDSPPILSANESLLLADAADGSLFCVMRDHSRYEQVNKAWQRVNAAGGKVAGVVFNNVPASDYVRTYGSYNYQLD